VHNNSDRDAINTASFLKYLAVNGSSNAILVLSSDIQVLSKANGNTTLTNTQIFHSQCGESDTSTYNKSKVDPVLKLYPHCPIMLNENSDVRGGVANGSQGTTEGVELKSDATIHHVKFHGFDLKAVLASEVCLVRIKLLALHHLCEKKIVPKESTFSCKYPLPREFQSGRSTRFKLKMKARQLPMVSNSATTGHKLQGASKDHLYIPFWHYGTPNWPYVMISRVRTREGLFIGEPLNPDKNFELDSRITRMLQQFQKLLPEDFVHDY
jgi:hypothetical protein